MGIHFITGWSTFNYANKFEVVPLRNKAKWFESWLNDLEAGWTVHMHPNGLHSKEKWPGIQHLHMHQRFLVTSVPLCCTIFMTNFSSLAGWPKWRVTFPMTHNQEVLKSYRYHFVQSMVGFFTICPQSIFHHTHLSTFSSHYTHDNLHVCI